METAPEFETFSYKDCLARRRAHSYIGFPRAIELVESGQGNPFWALLSPVKDRAGEAITRLVPEPATALLHGIPLCIRAGIPEARYEAYNATGTSHMLVVSKPRFYHRTNARVTSLQWVEILGKEKQLSGHQLSSCYRDQRSCTGGSWGNGSWGSV